MLSSIALSIYALTLLFDMFALKANMSKKKARQNRLMLRKIMLRGFLLVMLILWMMRVMFDLVTIEPLNVILAFMLGYTVITFAFGSTKASYLRLLNQLVSYVGVVVVFVVLKISFFVIMEPWLLFLLVGVSITAVIVFVMPFYEHRMIKKIRLTPFIHGLPSKYFSGRLHEDNVFMMQAEGIRFGPNALLWDGGREQKVLISPRLLVKLNAFELESIIMHEIGHASHKHMLKRLVAIVSMVIVYLVMNVLLFNYFDASETLVFSTMVFSVNIIFFKLVKWAGFALMHHQEYQADMFAVKQGHGGQLKSALEKLTRLSGHGNAHPLYAALFLTHPDIVHRLRPIENYLERNAN